MPKVRFYDPHPGMLGAAIPLPEHVRIIAQSLDGTRGDLDEAMEQIRDAVWDIQHASVSVSIGYAMIVLTIGSMENPPIHSWRVIRFRL